MKRDFDLIRKILQEVEEKEPFATHTNFRFEGYDELVIHEHIELLVEAGLIEGSVTRYADPKRGMHMIRRLTWSGHDFLDSMKDDNTWRKVREKFIKPAGGIAFEMLKELLKKEARERFGLPIP